MNIRFVTRIYIFIFVKISVYNNHTILW